MAPLEHPPSSLPPRYTSPTPPAPISTRETEQTAQEFQTFLSFVFSVSIFGASAFAVVVGQMTDPQDLRDAADDPPPFSLQRVRSFIGCAWLCFILSLAVAGYTSSAFTILRRTKAPGGHDYGGGWNWEWEMGGILVSGLLHLLLIGAFLFLSLAMVAYVGGIAWVAVGCCAAAGVLAVTLVAYQLAGGPGTPHSRIATPLS